jgi:hypothetical protein
VIDSYDEVTFLDPSAATSLLTWLTSLREATVKVIILSRPYAFSASSTFPKLGEIEALGKEYVNEAVTSIIFHRFFGPRATARPGTLREAQETSLDVAITKMKDDILACCEAPNMSAPVDDVMACAAEKYAKERLKLELRIGENCPELEIKGYISRADLSVSDLRKFPVAVLDVLAARVLCHSSCEGIEKLASSPPQFDLKLASAIASTTTDRHWRCECPETLKRLASETLEKFQSATAAPGVRQQR